eukprot:UC4_evm1s181
MAVAEENPVSSIPRSSYLAPRLRRHRVPQPVPPLVDIVRKDHIKKISCSGQLAPISKKVLDSNPVEIKYTTSYFPDSQEEHTNSKARIANLDSDESPKNLELSNSLQDQMEIRYTGEEAIQTETINKTCNVVVYISNSNATHPAPSLAESSNDDEGRRECVDHETVSEQGFFLTEPQDNQNDETKIPATVSEASVLLMPIDFYDKKPKKLADRRTKQPSALLTKPIALVKPLV